MENYESVIEKIKDDLTAKQNEITFKRRSLKSITKKDFAEILKITGTNQLMIAGTTKNSKPVKFEIFEHLKPTINKLYKYTIGDGYDVNSGIALLGNKGVGKTILILSFLDLLVSIGAITGYSRISARTFHNLDDKEQYEKNVLFIEEFGKSPDKVMDFGTTGNPLSNLLMTRYETRQITFIDSNLGLKSLNGIYGTLLEDRFRQMFNFIEIKGESLRGK